jgi:hypothetical protein
VIKKSKGLPWSLICHWFFRCGIMFYLGMTKDSKRKTGWITYLEFKIVLHEKDRALLELIKLFFGGRGSILNGGKGLVKYQVRSIYDLAIIIAHFDKYPLITKKLAAQLRSCAAAQPIIYFSNKLLK